MGECCLYFLVLYVLRTIGILLSIYLGVWFLFDYVKNSKVLYTIAVVATVLNLIFDNPYVGNSSGKRW